MYKRQGNDETVFSRTAESVRKDVECFFEILKGSFRVLKLRVGYHSQESIDNIFFTCCILHNMLHAFDGIDKFEENVGCLGPKKLSKIFLENIIWEIWEASYGSEIFFSGFDGGM